MYFASIWVGYSGIFMALLLMIGPLSLNSLMLSDIEYLSDSLVKNNLIFSYDYSKSK